MLENGGFLGLLAGVLVCGVLVFLGVMENKKIKEELNIAMEKISKEDLEKIKNAGFEDYTEDQNYLVGTSIVSAIEENTDKIKVKLFFYNGFWTQYVIYVVNMEKEKYVQKNIHVGDFVKTLHKR